MLSTRLNRQPMRAGPDSAVYVETQGWTLRDAVPALPESLTGHLHTLARHVRRAHGAVSEFGRARRQRRATERLRSLDDRTLKDIGLHRTEILSVIYGPADQRRIRKHVDN